jgi:Cytochrome P460
MRYAVSGRSLLVFSMLLASCANEGAPVSPSLNQNASLVGKLPANPLRWKVISSELNTIDATMSTLYGNDAAVEYARTHAPYEYPPGAALSLVRWGQRPDDRWFGAKIPDHVNSVEFVFVQQDAGGSTSYSYEKYEGAPLQLSTAQQGFIPNERSAELLSQRAAVLP